MSLMRVAIYLNQSYLFSEEHFDNIVSKQSRQYIAISIGVREPPNLGGGRRNGQGGVGVGGDLLARRLYAMPECESVEIEM